jgi:hypothetical protein
MGQTTGGIVCLRSSTTSGSDSVDRLDLGAVQGRGEHVLFEGWLGTGQDEVRFPVRLELHAEGHGFVIDTDGDKLLAGAQQLQLAEPHVEGSAHETFAIGGRVELTTTTGIG